MTTYAVIGESLRVEVNDDDFDDVMNSGNERNFFCFI